MGQRQADARVLHVDDMAAACVHVMAFDPAAWQGGATEPMFSHSNMSTGEDCTMLELDETVAPHHRVQGPPGVRRQQPDGTPRKLLDVGRLASLVWKASIKLEDGPRDAYRWFQTNEGGARSV